MSGFYRFPAMAEIDGYESIQQCAKICDEANEAFDACAKMLGCFYLAYDSESKERYESAYEARNAYGMELMDVIHAAETALRMEFTSSEVDMLRDMVEAKNRERGYYGE